MEPMCQQLLAAAQCGNLKQLAGQAEAFAASCSPGDFGRVAHAKSGDGVLHVLARGGHVDCIRFLMEKYSGREHVDIEIRYLVLKLVFSSRFCLS